MSSVLSTQIGGIYLNQVIISAQAKTDQRENDYKYIRKKNRPCNTIFYVAFFFFSPSFFLLILVHNSHSLFCYCEFTELRMYPRFR